MQHSRLLRALLLIASLGSVSMPAFAGAIATDTWYCGRFEATGSELFGGSIQALSVCDMVSGRTATIFGTEYDLFGDPGDAPWTVTVGSLGAQLLVVDVETSGDRFELFDDGNSLGQTSVPVFGTEDCDADVACALANTDYSQGTFDLAPGLHSLSGEFLGDVEYGDFAFIVRSNTEVPAPAGIAVAGLALGLFGLRRKARAAA